MGKIETWNFGALSFGLPPPIPPNLGLQASYRVIFYDHCILILSGIKGQRFIFTTDPENIKVSQPRFIRKETTSAQRASALGDFTDFGGFKAILATQFNDYVRPAWQIRSRSDINQVVGERAEFSEGLARFPWSWHLRHGWRRVGQLEAIAPPSVRKDQSA